MPPSHLTGSTSPYLWTLACIKPWYEAPHCQSWLLALDRLSPACGLLQPLAPPKAAIICFLSSSCKPCSWTCLPLEVIVSLVFLASDSIVFFPCIFISFFIMFSTSSSSLQKKLPSPRFCPRPSSASPYPFLAISSILENVGLPSLCKWLANSSKLCSSFQVLGVEVCISTCRGIYIEVCIAM